MAYSLGVHQIKFGTDLIPSEGRATQFLKDKPSGDYLLLFQQGLTI